MKQFFSPLHEFVSPLSSIKLTSLLWEENCRMFGELAKKAMTLVKSLPNGTRMTGQLLSLVGLCLSVYLLFFEK